MGMKWCEPLGGGLWRGVRGLAGGGGTDGGGVEVGRG